MSDLNTNNPSRKPTPEEIEEHRRKIDTGLTRADVEYMIWADNQEFPL